MMKRNRRIKYQVFGHYSNWTFACSCCGVTEREFLTIDHVAGDANKTSREFGIPRGGSPLYSWLLKSGLPPGFEVVCMNCNSSKWKHGECVHKKMNRSASDVGQSDSNH